MKQREGGEEVEYKYKLTEDKIEQILLSLQGLTQNQWSTIKIAIDYAYSNKAAKVRIDSFEEVEIVKSLLKL